MKIFCGSSDKTLANKVANYFNVTLSKVEIHKFSDGEKRVRIVERVIDQDCIVFQNRFASADCLYMESFFLIDALKRSRAKSVTLVLPYLAYQRQDHLFREGESVSLEVIRDILNALGLDRLITFDLHSIKTASVFNFEVSHLLANKLFIEQIKNLSAGNQSLLLVSPDGGGVRRVKEISRITGIPYVYILKNRDLITGAITAEEKIETIPREWFNAKLKIALIIDDMITSGATIAKAAEVMRKNGADKVVSFATHAVFSSGSEKNLKGASLNEVFVTDTLHLNMTMRRKFSNLNILSVDKIIVDCIKDLKIV